jgi:hypothetical protein
MPRKEELYRKCSTLLHAFAGCQTDFSTVLLSKYFELRRQLKSMSIETGLEDRRNHESHICLAAGIMIVSRGSEMIAVDHVTKQPITWGALIERMNT